MRPKELISHTGSATGLVNGRSSFRVVHDSLKRVGNVQHKTRRELSICLTGIYQTRSVGNKLASEHHLAHCCEKFVPLLTRFGSGNVADYTAHNVGPLF